ncbi:MAG TPA: SDR family NAD(P)-dependent oxidoreductase [Stellaceae bacterium]|nr:SDR family NAD(P)-dependent oxidoreductase [Stellaceae bacterium]
MKADALFDVCGRVTVVTGAASGLGLAMAEVMAENGAIVAMLDIDQVGLDAAVTRLAAAGHAVEGIAIDVSDIARLRAGIDAVAEKRGRLDVVFANAGISAGRSFEFPEGEVDAVDMARWNQVLQVNLTSVFVTIQVAAERMKARRSGRIIVTSSIAGIRAERMVGYAYAATKAAVNNLVRQAALELAPYNVMINAIAPGPFFTNIAGGRLHREPEFVQKFAAMVPLGRIAKPDELKGLALLLASPASSYITGTVIPIDGGITAG